MRSPGNTSGHKRVWKCSIRDALFVCYILTPTLVSVPWNFFSCPLGPLALWLGIDYKARPLHMNNVFPSVSSLIRYPLDVCSLKVISFVSTLSFLLCWSGAQLVFILCHSSLSHRNQQKRTFETWNTPPTTCLIPPVTLALCASMNHPWQTLMRKVNAPPIPTAKANPPQA
jgi:hypothetical protein